ncbi:Hsp20/alpha crystallin family protein [Halobacterium jilantaiense]|uniref:Molecular chaperone IbpA, HSP20 family n=1 Tax=Halobacterium jilantaiense TaxID=355548 RepID=A0A1I0QEG2_9EURY|nr:Hsp20/alpha crystallin family protein [Halobacterium jilantaiense]SEW25471.1 Molecular chaperone IbpA, HSP20 family [Halobacterium jilantaiense]
MSRLREALGNLPDAVFADVHERDDEYLFVVDVPGVSAADLDVRVSARTVVVDAHRRKSVPDGFDYREEERPLFLDLELPLPPDATADGATASVDDGVLEVHLPRRGESGQRVPVEG